MQHCRSVLRDDQRSVEDQGAHLATVSPSIAVKEIARISRYKHHPSNVYQTNEKTSKTNKCVHLKVADTWEHWRYRWLESCHLSKRKYRSFSLAVSSINRHINAVYRTAYENMYVLGRRTYMLSNARGIHREEARQG